MAIDRVKKATFLAPRKEARRFLNALHALSAIDIEDAAETLGAVEGGRPTNGAASTDTVDQNLKKLDIIRSTFEMFVQTKKGFIPFGIH